MIVSFVVGADIPPVRGSLIKSLLLPCHSKTMGCLDRDCLIPSCKGDRLEVSGWNESESGGTDLTLHVVHGKNDRRHQHGDFSVGIPDGLFKDLLLSHVEEGRAALEAAATNTTCIKLFVSQQGNPFSDATFIHYWRSTMASAAAFGLTYITPTIARTVFVEDYSSHCPPQFWEGAATVMGNTVRQWKASYMPSRKRKLVQNMAYNFQAYVDVADMNMNNA